MTERELMLTMADELEKSVGLYRKMPDGQMVEMHVKKIALIQAALRRHMSDERIAELQYEAGMYQSLYENALEVISRLREEIAVMRTDCILAEDEWAKLKIQAKGR